MSFRVFYLCTIQFVDLHYQRGNAAPCLVDVGLLFTTARFFKLLSKVVIQHMQLSD